MYGADASVRHSVSSAQDICGWWLRQKIRCSAVVVGLPSAPSSGETLTTDAAVIERLIFGGPDASSGLQ